MTTFINFIKLLKPRLVKRSPADFEPSECFQCWRGFADRPKSDSSKQVMIQGTDKDEKLRVRRARPADTPRILRFVRENARVAWPSFDSPSSNFHLILGDYVSRALAQGHSMLAEQPELKHGWSQIRGLAISTTVCPWDAMTLKTWAKCVRCKRSRQLVHFTAHCLRAPALHDKYKVHNVLQVILIVPPDVPRASEIVHMLAKNTIKRGREVGLPVLRFDVTNDPVAKVLEELNLTKEWELTYNLLPGSLKDKNKAIVNSEGAETEKQKDSIKNNSEDKEVENPLKRTHFIAVYTATNITKL